jgi:hypothetical protein
MQVVQGHMHSRQGAFSAVEAIQGLGAAQVFEFQQYLCPLPHPVPQG